MDIENIITELRSIGYEILALSRYFETDGVPVREYDLSNIGWSFMNRLDQLADQLQEAEKRRKQQL